jgi:hypothetical protein
MRDSSRLFPHTTVIRGHSSLGPEKTTKKPRQNQFRTNILHKHNAYQYKVTPIRTSTKTDVKYVSSLPCNTTQITVYYNHKNFSKNRRKIRQQLAL